MKKENSASALRQPGAMPVLSRRGTLNSLGRSCLASAIGLALIASSGAWASESEVAPASITEKDVESGEDDMRFPTGLGQPQPASRAVLAPEPVPRASTPSNTFVFANFSRYPFNYAKAAIDSIAVGQGSDAAGVESIAVGMNASTDGARAAAFGTSSHGGGASSLALGTSSVAWGDESITIGSHAYATKVASVALGRGASAEDAYVVALGSNAAAIGWASSAVGAYAKAEGSNSVALGFHAFTEDEAAIAVGVRAQTANALSIAIGADTSVKGTDSVAIGSNSLLAGDESVSLGARSQVMGTDVVGIGSNVRTTNSNTTAVGANAEVNGVRNVALGTNTRVGTLTERPEHAVALGAWSVAEESNTVSIGDASIGLARRITNVADATGFDEAATLGQTVFMVKDATRFSDARGMNDASATGEWSTAMGAGTQATTRGTTALGGYSVAFGDGSTAVGYLASGTGIGALAGGVRADAQGHLATALGGYSLATGYKATAVGYGSKIDYGVDNATAIGWEARVDATGSVALGASSRATESGVVSVGNAQSKLTRRLVNVSDATNDHDAVNLAQLRTAEARIESNAGRLDGQELEISQLQAGLGSARFIAVSDPLAAGAAAPGKGSLALGENASAFGAGSVALGTGSRADANGVVSVGDTASGLTRRVVNVDRGVEDTDAANYGQVLIVDQRLQALSDDLSATVKPAIEVNHTLLTGTVVPTLGDHARLIAGLDARNRAWDDVFAYDRPSQLGAAAVEGEASIAIGAGSNAVTHSLLGSSVSVGTSSVAVNGSTAVGTGATARGLSTAFGVSATSAEAGTALGSHAEASGGNAVAIGLFATAKADRSFALGAESLAENYRAMALGSETRARGADSVALGFRSVSSAERSVALGSDSRADEANTISVGDAGSERRITNVAAGTKDTDAVNLAQLRGTSLFDPEGKARTAVTYASDLSQITFAGLNGTRLSNVADGLIAHGSRDAVNGGQLASLSERLDERVGLVDARVGDVEKRVADGYLAQGDDVEGGNSRLASSIEKAAYAGRSNGSLALGEDAIATGAASVALGLGSRALQDNVVSIGDEASGMTRRLINVAAGSEASDAATVGQLRDVGRLAQDIGDDVTSVIKPAIVKNSSLLGNVVIPELDEHERMIAGMDARNRAWDDVFAYDRPPQLGAASVEGEASIAIGAGSNAVTHSLLGSSVSVGTSSVAVNASTAVGTGATARGFSIAFGVGATSAVAGTALGSHADASGGNAVAIGLYATAKADWSFALGTESLAENHRAMALGAETRARGVDSIALGFRSVSSAERSVALGSYSRADEANTISVGDVGSERRITNVAAGTKDTDAVNLAQLRGTSLFDPEGKARTAVTYANDLSQITFAGLNGTRLSNVADGLIARGSRDAINGGQLASLTERLDQRIDTVDGRLDSLEGAAVPESETTVASLRSGSADAPDANDGVKASPGASELSPGAVGEVVAADAPAVEAPAAPPAARAEPARVQNVAAGEAPTDGVNVAQLNTQRDEAIRAARAYTDDRVDAVRGEVDDLRKDVGARFQQVDRRIDRMAAMSGAYAGMAMNTAGLEGIHRVGVGVGSQRGEKAIAVGYQHVIGKRASFSIGGASGGKDRSVNAGAGFSW